MGKTLFDLVHTDKDIHSLTASNLYDKPVDEVTCSERSIAKKANFGLLYGMGAKNFAREVTYSSDEITMSVEEAKQVRKRFFDGYSGLLPFYDRIIGYGETG